MSAQWHVRCRCVALNIWSRAWTTTPRCGMAIHDRSGRRARTFVKVNCAAIPSTLLESELFGHERGAFTDAVSQRIGRFEVADGGTLFLDEVGELPLEVQPKLLQVIQEQEFERVGGTRTIKVDVRIVAATNRNLAQLVEEKRFRDDLYYRLNVFPIQVPPLRERPEDIPALVRFFVQRLARPMNRRVEVIPKMGSERKHKLKSRMPKLGASGSVRSASQQTLAVT